MSDTGGTDGDAAEGAGATSGTGGATGPAGADVTRPLPVVRDTPVAPPTTAPPTTAPPTTAPPTTAPAAIDPQGPPPADFAPSTPPAPPAPSARATTAAPVPTPRPAPGPGRHAAPDTGAGPSRRWFLVGAGAVVLAAGGGVGAAFLRPEDEDSPTRAPAELLAAIAAERSLLADLDATTGGDAAIRAVITQVRADHAAHLTALVSLTAPIGASAAPSSTTPAGTPRTAGQLRSAEQRAAQQAAARAGALDGRTAVVLASIAACEAGHAELLT